MISDYGVFPTKYCFFIDSLLASLIAQMVKNLPECRRPRFNPWGRKIPGERNGNPLQYSCLENSRNRGAWSATIHGVAKSQTQLNDFQFDFRIAVVLWNLVYIFGMFCLLSSYFWGLSSWKWLMLFVSLMMLQEIRIWKVQILTCKIKMH